MIETTPAGDNQGWEDWGARMSWTIDESTMPSTPAAAHADYKVAQSNLDDALYAFEVTGGQSNELALESAFSNVDDRASACEEFFGMNDEKGCTHG